MCRSRRELSNAYYVAKFGFDTADNEPCPLSAYRSPSFAVVGWLRSGLHLNKFPFGPGPDITLPESELQNSHRPPQVLLGAGTAARIAPGGRLEPDVDHRVGKRIGHPFETRLISAKCCSFSAVSAPIFARKYAFCSIFQNLPDYLAKIFAICNFSNSCAAILKADRRVNFLISPLRH